MTDDHGFRAAIAAAGGFTAAASRIGVSKGVLWAWANRGQVPPEWCPRAEQVLSAGRWVLRPTDWHLIWPELVGTEGAPPAPAETNGA